MPPFLPETELPREPRLSCVMRCEFLFVSLSACAEYNTVESDKVAPSDFMHRFKEKIRA